MRGSGGALLDLGAASWGVVVPAGCGRGRTSHGVEEVGVALDPPELGDAEAVEGLLLVLARVLAAHHVARRGDGGARSLLAVRAQRQLVLRLRQRLRHQRRALPLLRARLEQHRRRHQRDGVVEALVLAHQRLRGGAQARGLSHARTQHARHVLRAAVVLALDVRGAQRRRGDLDGRHQHRRRELHRLDEGPRRQERWVVEDRGLARVGPAHRREGVDEDAHLGVARGQLLDLHVQHGPRLPRHPVGFDVRVGWKPLVRLRMLCVADGAQHFNEILELFVGLEHVQQHHRRGQPRKHVHRGVEVGGHSLRRR
eukprot:1450787-Rhodomonas_salina.2